MYFFYLFNLSHSLKGVISWSNAKFSKLTWWELYDTARRIATEITSEMIKLVKTTSKKFVLEGEHYWVHCSLAYELVLLVIIQMSKYDISHIFVTVLVKVVANHQHVQVLINGVSSEWPGWIGWWWNYIRFRAHLDDIRGMATTCAFRVIGVDSSAL